MKLYRALLLCYLAAVAINIASGQGSGNGNDNGQYNVRSLQLVAQASATPYTARIAKHDKCYNKSKDDFANLHSTLSLSEKSIAFEERVWSLDQARVR